MVRSFEGLLPLFFHVVMVSKESSHVLVDFLESEVPTLSIDLVSLLISAKQLNQHLKILTLVKLLSLNHFNIALLSIFILLGTGYCLQN